MENLSVILFPSTPRGIFKKFQKRRKKGLTKTTVFEHSKRLHLSALWRVLCLFVKFFHKKSNKISEFADLKPNFLKFLIFNSVNHYR